MDKFKIPHTKYEFFNNFEALNDGRRLQEENQMFNRCMYVLMGEFNNPRKRSNSK